MSLEIDLVSTALDMVREAREDRRRQRQGLTVAETEAAESGASRQIAIRSRLKDGGLLRESLQELGVTLTEVQQHRVAGQTIFGGLTFRRSADSGGGDDGVWTVHFEESWEPEGAERLITDLDEVYARRVQQEVLRRIRERAPQTGMDVVSETVEEDRTVTLLLNVQR